MFSSVLDTFAVSFFIWKWLIWFRKNFRDNDCQKQRVFKFEAENYLNSQKIVLSFNPSQHCARKEAEHLSSFSHSFASSLKALVALGCSQPSQQTFTAHHTCPREQQSPVLSFSPQGSVARAEPREMSPSVPRSVASWLHSPSQAAAKQGCEFSTPESEIIPQSGLQDFS